MPPTAVRIDWKLCWPCRNAARYSVMSPSDSPPRAAPMTMNA